jgi:hypothetical protein
MRIKISTYDIESGHHICDSIYVDLFYPFLSYCPFTLIQTTCLCCHMQSRYLNGRDLCWTIVPQQRIQIPIIVRDIIAKLLPINRVENDPNTINCLGWMSLKPINLYIFRMNYVIFFFDKWIMWYMLIYWAIVYFLPLNIVFALLFTSYIVSWSLIIYFLWITLVKFWRVACPYNILFFFFLSIDYWWVIEI